MANIEILGDADLAITEPIDQLDENIVETLTHRSKKSRLSESSKATYRAIIRDFNRFLAQNGLQLGQAALQGYFDDINGRYRAATLNLRKYALMKILKAQLGENNILLTMAIEKVFEGIHSYQTDSAVAQEGCLNEDDVQRLITVAQSVRTKLLIQFLFKTGCRVSEMINVRLPDCEPANAHVKVRIIGKGNKERKVYIPSDLYAAIRSEYRGAVYLFESRTGDRLKRNNVFVQIRKAGERAGFAAVHPIQLECMDMMQV